LYFSLLLLFSVLSFHQCIFLITQHTWYFSPSVFFVFSTIS
jgi:hypothetical protein